MSWVSQANIKTIMTAIRNKFTTSDLVIANDAKDTGVELNYASQDGLVTVSPISTSASTEAALHLSNGDDTKKTELTQGTLSYVTGTGSSETYNYMSLLGDGVTFGKNGGGNVQLGGVADPTSAQQVATKNYVDRMFYTFLTSTSTTSVVTVASNSFSSLGINMNTNISQSQYDIVSCNVYTDESDNVDDVYFTTHPKIKDGYWNVSALALNSGVVSKTIPSGTKINILVVLKRI